MKSGNGIGADGVRLLFAGLGPAPYVESLNLGSICRDTIFVFYAHSTNIDVYCCLCL